MEEIDLNKYIQIFLKRKKIVLVVLIISVSVFFGFSMFKNYSLKALNYKNEIKDKVQKMDIIISLDKSKEDLAKYKSSFVKWLDEESLLNQLSDYATQNKVSIINVSPGQLTSKDDYNMINVKLSIRADSFVDLISFFHTIETAPYVFKIMDWGGSINPENGSFSCNIDIIYVQMR